jgi:flagella basal body P-ring formation protein FlgA
MARTTLLCILCLLLPLAVMASTGPACEIIPIERLAELYREAILTHSPWKDKGDIVIEAIKAPTSFKATPVDMETVQAKFAPREDFLGFTSITLVCGFAGTEKVMVSGMVRVFAEVPVAKSEIRRGTLIEAADLEVRRIDITQYPASAMDMQHCVGMRAKSFIRKGAPVLLANIDVPPLVYKGAPVMIEVLSQDLLVSDKGIALMDGRADERILVRNMRSGRKIIGTVIAPSRVRVEF